MAVNEIRYKGVSYATDDDIKVPSGVLYEVKALRSDSLEANSLTVTVFSNDKAIMGFAKNDKVEYFRDGRRVGVYYLQTVERVGSDAYTLSALSALGRLITMRHAGGIYTGQTVAEVVPQICGPVAVMIESVYASRKLYGYLPYSNPDTRTGNGRSARDNLSQVLFAIGASLGIDENGVMRVEKLWDGVSAMITADQINEDSCSTVYETPVSAVEITEHQWVKSQDTVTLFEGTAEDGALVTFEDPAHSLTAEGFAITEQGDNYAILSAGTGTLTGKSYNHLTRIVRRTVTEGAEENVVTVSDATLVSLTNSVDVAKRMADYYRHRETIRVDVEPGTERAGRVVQIFHPWDKEMVQACVESRETVISGILNSQTSALVGFKPAQPEAAEYFDVVEILTGSGEWEVPPDVTVYTRVLIGGAQGGWSGLPGGRAEASRVETGTTMGGSRYAFRDYTDGGAGGSPGAPGAGGKVLTETVFNAVPGEKIPYSCGKGGKGGIYSADGSAPGEFGTATTMGAVSSEKGASSDDGYTDINSGKKFAERGIDGVAGSKGRGRKYVEAEDAYVDLPSPDIVVDGVHYTAGADNPIEKDGGAGDYTVAPYGYLAWKGQGGLGGGAAYKANGGQETDAPDGHAVIFTDGAIVTCWGGRGGKGADALPPDKETKQYGRGGAGGNGGGGAGGTGKAYTRQRIKDGLTLKAAELNPVQISGDPGKGSDGGEGADGCIILYYRKFGQVKAGPLVQRGGGLFFDRLNKLFIV